MLLNGDLKCFYHLLGGVEVGMPEDIQQPVIAKLVLLRIFGFVKSVGIDEELHPDIRVRARGRWGHWAVLRGNHHDAHLRR